jgi:L-amino acid N-acyltransferase YncA
MAEDASRDYWMHKPPGRTTIAIDDGGVVLGSAAMYPNRGGGGAHVASASFMVDPRQPCRGTGLALGEDALDWARREGYQAMQFNAVVETNERAVRLWKALGFTVMATIPEAFAHPTHGYVGLLVMHRFL